MIKDYRFYDWNHKAGSGIWKFTYWETVILVPMAMLGEKDWEGKPPNLWPPKMDK